MVREISGLGNPPHADTRTSSRSPNNSDKTAIQSEPSAKVAKQDGVELSNEAKNLSTLASRIGDLPEVNESRVAQLKAALENGELTIDNKRLADNLLAADEFF